MSQKQLRTRGGELADLVTFVTQRGDRKFYSDTIGSDLNLYVANKLLDGWGRGERLADNINSRWNENYPFLMLDGLTLYFASDDENSLGGYDIFITRYSPNTNDYLTPENVGMPFNSLANDYMMVIDEINGTGWFVSDRFQPEGRVMIYHFRYEEEKDYVRGDDGDVLRKTAMLVISKQATLPEKSISNVKTLPVVPEPERILFQVNDSVAYSDANEFKSQKALKMWYELEKSKKELSRQEEGLTELRSEYDKTGADQDRKRLSEKIAGLEKDIIQSKLLLKEKEISIRNEEINYLKN